ncbi:uncharacterized protein LOC119840611 [Zerene cesonia]|uniref:uncharacterized protein LOC119840611 n=1 Tax=Zerene cesonia TaxID=33412 RepID=UPI0018E5611E|nr:uncharacterized protein LOC119840611 [Zerene cesonia]
MMRCWIAVIFIGLQIVTSNGSVSYCGSRMCGHTNGHTFCRYLSGPGPTCLGFMQAPLTIEDKVRIMARLNRRRSDIAMGLNDWPPAADMLKLRWVDELSREAQLWADQCRPPSHVEEHDACRDLYSISVGQCVASIVGEAPGLRPETMVDIWYMQRISYEGNFTSYIPSSDNYYGDFAQMIWSRTYMVGCGRSRFMALWRGRIRSVERLVCNFAPRGPIPTRALWTPGAPASMCPSRSRPDPDVPGLCTFLNEIKMPEGTGEDMGVEEHLLLNTVLELENNDTLNYMGSLDEHYLKTVAMATIDYLFTSEIYYNNNLYKREAMENTLYDENATHLNKEGTSIVPDSTPSQNKITIKKKVSLVGRPKPYNLEELDDPTIPKLKRNEIVEDTTEKWDLYADFDYKELDNYGITMNTLASNNTSTGHEVQELDSHIDASLGINTFQNTEKYGTPEIELRSNFSMTLNVSNPISYETTKDYLDDYLSDPETFRQLQEALERMENNLADPATVVGKVRREIRTQQPDSNATQPRRISKQQSEELLAEIERNKTRQRGPMLNMVLKYLPYLKPYENTILGEDSPNNAERIMPSIILLLVLCM